MDLSTTTRTSVKRLGGAKAIELIANAGFDAIDYSMAGKEVNDNLLSEDNHVKGALELKKHCNAMRHIFQSGARPFSFLH